MPRAQVRGQPLPHLQPQGPRCEYAVNAQQVHAAQDERHDAGLQVRASRQTDARHVAAVAGGTGHPTELWPAKVVDATAQHGLQQRPTASVHILPPQHLGGAEAQQVLVRFRLAGDGPHLIAATGQQVNGQRTHAARGAIHGDGSAGWGLPVLFHAVNGQGRREPRRANLHRLAKR